jgi:hypothetical protein
MGGRVQTPSVSQSTTLATVRPTVIRTVGVVDAGDVANRSRPSMGTVGRRGRLPADQADTTGQEGIGHDGDAD